MSGASALIVGGNGQIGRAAARRLAEAGFDVTVVGRSGRLADGLAELGVSSARADRTADGELEAVVRDGVDVLVDVIAFTLSDAEQILALGNRIGSAIVISSASVYADDQGRTLDEADSVKTFPHLPVPVAESQPTVAPSDQTYSTRKVAVERALLASDLAVTVIRPCAVHGPGSGTPRELFFVRRALDGRRGVVLVSNGDSRFHTTSVANLAHVIRLAAEQPGARVVNCGDPTPPSVCEIGAAIGASLGHEFELLGIPDDGYQRRDLSNPWAVPLPFIVDTSAATRELGYRPVTTYEDAVRETCAWLVPRAYRDWSSTYLQRYLDYRAEDVALAELRAT
jgi:nucleoside-diphosphate-sugar epimerase